MGVYSPLGYLCARRPSAKQMLSGVSAHRGTIASSALGLLVLFAIAGDILIYLAPSVTYFERLLALLTVDLPEDILRPSRLGRETFESSDTVDSCGMDRKGQA